MEPSNHILVLQKRWYDAIYEGDKTIEGRKGSEKYSCIRVGDTILFKCAHETPLELSVKVVAVREYKTLTSYLSHEGLNRTLPGVDTIEEGISVYVNRPVSWTDEEVKKYGIRAIEFVRNV